MDEFYIAFYHNQGLEVYISEISLTDNISISLLGKQGTGAHLNFLEIPGACEDPEDPDRFWNLETSEGLSPFPSVSLSYISLSLFFLSLAHTPAHIPHHHHL